MSTSTTEAEAPTLDVEVPDSPAALGQTGESSPALDSVPDTKPARTPRRRRSSTAGKSRTDKPPRARSNTRSKSPKIGEGMAGLYTMLGVSLTVVPSGPAKGIPGATVTQAIGQTIVENAAACGEAWEKVAAENPAVREALEKLLTVTVFGQLVAAHTPILVAATVAGGIVPAALVGPLMGQESGQA